MDMLAKLKAECARLGHKQGESAAQFRRRDPAAAKELAEFIAKHQAQIVKQVAALVK